MIEGFIGALSGAGVEATADEIADVLWLAAKMKLAPRPRAPVIDVPPPRPDTPPAGGVAPPPVAPPPARAPAEAAPVVLPSPGRSARPGLPFRAPGAAAIPDALAVGRALRPLARRVPSRTRWILDEAASAEQIAETRAALPVIRPEPVRWLDLALVIDAGASMAVWRRTIAELKSLLHFHGAFRDVRSYRLLTDGTLTLGPDGLPAAAAARVTRSSARELVDPAGRRLVVVVTDCVSREWRSGAVTAMIGELSRKGPVGMLQLLPASLWARTSMRGAPRVLLRATAAGSPNTRLRVAYVRAPASEPDDLPPPLPVMTLDAASIRAFARLVAGSPGEVSGVIPIPAPPARARTAAGVDPLDRFLSTASPEACSLARFLSAVPVSLSVMRLVRQAMVPSGGHAAIAEVYLSGLLQKVPGQDAAIDADEVQYDFLPGVRERLLDLLPGGDAQRVLSRLSEQIVGRERGDQDFAAFIEEAAASGASGAEARPLAMIAASVLSRLGGDYARLAEKLSGGDAPMPPPIERAEGEPEPQDAPRRQYDFWSDLAPGALLGGGRYELIEALGPGAIGVVWSARDRERREEVVIKFFYPHVVDARRLDDLQQRARALWDVRHHSIARVLSVETSSSDDPRVYAVFERADGVGLRDAMRRFEFTPETALLVISQLGEALAEVHASKLVHRRVEPSNVQIGGELRATLIDFAIEGDLGPSAIGFSTKYVAPEILAGAPDVDARADVYGLGLTTLFALCGGSPPEEPGDRAAWIERFGVNASTKAVLRRAIEPDRSLRFAEAGAFLTALREASRERPPEPPPAAESASISIPMEKRDDGLYLCKPEDARLLETHQLFLEASGAEESILRDRVRHLIKIASWTQIGYVLNAASTGARAELDPHPPSAVAPRAGCVYLRFEQEGDYWKNIVESGTLAIYQPMDPQHIELRLLAVPRSVEAAPRAATEDASDPYYLERPADQVALRLAPLPGQTLILEGARLCGRSSLLMRYLDGCREAGKRVALVDLQILSASELETYPSFLMALASAILDKLELTANAPAIRSAIELDSLLERSVLGAAASPVTLAFNEADRVLGRPYQSEFFSLLRRWHERRSMAGAWTRLDLVLLISVEPRLLIADPRVPPFNVAEPIELGYFTIEECRALNEQYPVKITSAQVEELRGLLGGHPYLTREAHQRIAVDRISFEELMRTAIDVRGPFGDHLRSLSVLLVGTPLLGALRQAIETGRLDESNPEGVYELMRNGLLRRRGERYEPPNRLYARFFEGLR